MGTGLIPAAAEEKAGDEADDEDRAKRFVGMLADRFIGDFGAFESFFLQVFATFARCFDRALQSRFDNLGFVTEFRPGSGHEVFGVVGHVLEVVHESFCLSVHKVCSFGLRGLLLLLESKL